MLDPLSIDPAEFFEFIAGAELAVLLVAVHPDHAFNQTLAQQLAAEHPGIAIGTIELTELILAGGAALRFLNQGLRSCEAPSSFGAMPGYYLFRRGEMLAWDAGLPTFADVEAIVRSALLGAVWSGVTRDLQFVRQALFLVTEQVAAQRVAARFRHAIANSGGSRRRAGASTAPPIDDLYWAYQRLGVLPTATDREVHEAWRRRRMETHPDLAAQDPVEFERRSRIAAEINRARDIVEQYRAGGARRATG